MDVAKALEIDNNEPQNVWKPPQHRQPLLTKRKNVYQSINQTELTNETKKMGKNLQRPLERLQSQKLPYDL